MNLFEKLNLSVSTTLTGLVIVFAALIVLTLLFALFGKALQRTARNNDVSAPEETPQIPYKAPNVVEDATGDEEVIAVIAAAVAALGSAAGKEYRIRKVRRASGRSEWAMAGLLNSTRPF